MSIYKPQFPQINGALSIGMSSYTPPLQASAASTAAPYQAPPTAYDLRYAATLSPFIKAKYGFGGGPPTSLQQLQNPRQATMAAGAISPQMSQFSPSATGGIAAPRLQPLQFGNQ